MNVSYDFPEIVPLILKYLTCKFHTDVWSMSKFSNAVELSFFILNVVISVLWQVDEIGTDSLHF